MNIFRAILVCAVFVPALAQAQEGGSVVIEYEGQSYEFPLQAGQSDWGGSTAYGSVNIYARPTDDATWALFKTLTLGFSFMGDTVDGAEISLTRLIEGDILQNVFGDEDTGLVVGLEEATVDGAFLSVSGQFSSGMGTSQNYGGTIDMANPMAISGSFNVILGPVE